MKPEQRQYILKNLGKKTTKQLAQELHLKERNVARFLNRQGKAGNTELSRKAEPDHMPSLAVWKIALMMALIVVAGFFGYINTLKGSFLWDDSHLVEENRFIRPGTDVKNLFSKDVGAGAENKYNFYRPLQILTYKFDYRFWKLNPTGYHLTNMLLHMGVAVALFWLVYVLYRDALLSLVTGLLFVSHPVHTEAVTYVSGRADPLAALFILLMFIFYHKAGQSKSLSWPVLVAVSYVCALLSRENSLIVPVLLLVYHYSFKKKIRLGLFLPVVFLAVLYIVMRFTLLSFILSKTAHTSGVFQRLPGFFAALASYLRILVLPVHLHMEYGSILFPFFHPQALIGILVFSFCVFVLYKQRQRPAAIFFPLSWFLVALIPVSNLYPLNAYMAEHWLYLPSMGLFLLAARPLAVLLRREKFKIPGRIIFTSIVFAGVILTYQQNNTWLKPIPFFIRTLGYAPFSSRVHNSLGMEYNRIGKYEQGARHLEQAVQLSEGATNRDAVIARNNLAFIYTNLGKNQEAAELAAKALTIDANHVKSLNNLAISYYRMGKEKEALEACQKAIALKPTYVKAHNTLGAIYLKQQRYPEALAVYQKILELAPDYPEANNNLGLVYIKMGRTQEAIACFKKALLMRPDYVNTIFNLAMAYEIVNQIDEAVTAYKEVLKMNPNYTGAYGNLAKIYLNKGQYSLAVEYFDRGQKLGLVNNELSKLLEPHRGK